VEKYRRNVLKEGISWWKDGQLGEEEDDDKEGWKFQEGCIFGKHNWRHDGKVSMYNPANFEVTEKDGFTCIYCGYRKFLDL